MAGRTWASCLGLAILVPATALAAPRVPAPPPVVVPGGVFPVDGPPAADPSLPPAATAGPGADSAEIRTAPPIERYREDAAGRRQSSKWHSLFFIIGAALAFCGAVATIVSRTPMRSVLGLLVAVVSTAGLYLLLHAELLAAVQVIVYAGAVVVLFAFVIMFLQQGAQPSPNDRWLPVRWAAAFAMVYFFYVVAPALAGLGMGGRAPVGPGFGTTAGLGDALFTTYLVPFEAVSALLLTAIVGAVAVAKGGPAAAPPASRDSAVRGEGG